MFGSTAGKALIFPIFLLTSFCIINLIGHKKLTIKKKLFLKLIITIVICSSLIWIFNFHQTINVAETYNFEFTRDGNHIQFCFNESYYNEFISLEHTHTLKALAHSTVLKNKEYITGESFEKLFDYNKTYPLILLIISLSCFLISLPYLKKKDLIDTLSYLFGYYMIFFSYFDGGFLSGFGGIFFLFFQFIEVKNNDNNRNQLLHSKEIKRFFYFFQFLLLKILIFLTMTTVYLQTFKVSQFLLFTKTTTASRLLILAIFNLVTSFNKKKLFVIILILTTTLFYFHHDPWHTINKWESPLNDGDQLLIQIYTDQPVNLGEKLLEFENSKLIYFNYTQKEKKTKWDFCQEILSETEGLSYKSLMVSVYCNIIKLELNKPASNITERGISYKTLKEGNCNVKCYDKLFELFSITDINGDKKLLAPHGRYHPLYHRTYGIPFCLTNATYVISEEYKKRLPTNKTINSSILNNEVI